MQSQPVENIDHIKQPDPEYHDVAIFPFRFSAVLAFLWARELSAKTIRKTMQYFVASQCSGRPALQRAVRENTAAHSKTHT